MERSSKPKDPRLLKSAGNSVIHAIQSAAHTSKQVATKFGDSQEHNSLSSREVEYCRKATPTVSTKTFSLYPPHSDDKLSHTTAKPIGCRTLRVSNLPTVVTEIICRNLFERFGPIESIKVEMGSKVKGLKVTKVCDVKFSKTEHVEKAVQCNGYYLLVAKPGTSIMPHLVGQLHINYVGDTQNLQEWQQDQQVINQIAGSCPPFSEAEATRILQFLKKPDSSLTAVKVVTEWLNTGMCTPMTVKTFFSLITTMNSSLQKIPFLLQDLKLLVKNNKKNEEGRKKDLQNNCDAVQDLFTSYSRVSIVFPMKHREHVEGYRLGAEHEISKVQKFISLQQDRLPSDYLDEVEVQRLKKIISQQQEEIKKLEASLLNAREDAEKHRGVAMENAKLVIRMSKTNSEMEVLEKEISELKKCMEESDLAMEKKDHEVKELKEAVVGLEKYVAHVSRERTKAKLLDDLINGTTEDSINDTEFKDMLTNENSGSTIGSFRIKEEPVDSDTAGKKRNHAEVNDEASNIKKIKTDDQHVKLTYKQLLLIPVLSVLLNSLPCGATSSEISYLLSGNNIDINKQTIESLLKDFPSIFVPYDRDGQNRWKLNVFEAF